MNKKDREKKPLAKIIVISMERAGQGLILFGFRERRENEERERVKSS